MRFATAAFALATLVSSAFAHMEMTEPIPFRSKLNKNSPNPDFDMTSPLSSNGSNFPCKGYQVDFGKPEGAPTATWAAGSQQKLGIDGGAAHNGGSCQLSISYDGGNTFKVIKSIEGGCVNPAGGPHTFDFTVPADAKSGDAIFAWTWFNHTGNREMYMNCAAVTITGSGTSTLDSNPDIFVADIGNGCTVPEGTDVVFPNPGSDVQVISQTSLGPPTGNCGTSSNPAPAPAPEPAPSSDETDTPVAAPTESTPADGDDDDDDDNTPAPTATSPETVPTDDPKNGIIYSVVAGDFCITIAQKTGTTVANILKNNPEINAGCTNLKPGQNITLRRRSRIMRNL